MTSSDTSTPRAGGSILGNPVVRKEDPKLLTEGGTYVSDVNDPLLDGAAHVHYVRATIAHARITGIDTSAALEMPGVIAVITAADLDDSLKPLPLDIPVFPKGMRRPWLAGEKVRYVGEPIAAIVTETRGQGPDAAEQVIVDYEPLPAVIDPEAALEDTVLVHEEAGTNLCLEIAPTATVDGQWATVTGSSEPPATVDLDACEVVVRERIINNKVAAAPIEPRVAASAWGRDGRLNHWTSCQGPHPFRDVLAKLYQVEPAQVRVVTPDVGGGFGAKAMPSPEDLLLPWIARRVGRPVRWFSNRTDDMVNLGPGRAQIQYAEMGGTRDGKILAYRLRVVQDGGAYPRYGAYLPNMTKLMQQGVYDIPAIEFSSKSTVTNTTPVAPFRGAGRPEAAACVERMVDRFAVEIGMDPAEVRRRNLLGDDVFPYVTKGGATYDSGQYREMLDRALAAAGYDELRAEQQRRRASGDRRLLGIGISCYVEVTAGAGGSEYASVEILPGGKVRALTGSLPYGTGHDTSWAMLISDRLGIPIDDIEIVHGDTDVVPKGGLTGGSRSLQLAGTSMHGAAGVVAEQARALAADLLEANPDDIVLDTDRGAFHVNGTPSVARTWAEIATAAISTGRTDALRAELEVDQKGGTFPSGAHVSVVEVDADTGKVTVLRHIACDDCGRILNPLIVAGQVHGGAAQGIAQALLEEMRYDEDGNPLTSNFADYGIISAAELPSFERIPLETPTPLNSLGAKGIGESGTIGATPAVHNAVVDAVAHLGVRHIDMPLTSEKVWRAISAVS